MHILHTESSQGWGGQEIRILKEAEGMRARGHEVIFAVAKGGGLIAKARAAGFPVYEVHFKKQRALGAVFQLIHLMRKHRIDLVNTHSSLDAWLGGIAARLLKKKIVRTRHLSTPIRKGLNSRLLYKGLTDFVVTTSSAIIPTICSQAGLSSACCRCIPTGVDPNSLRVSPKEIQEFRLRLQIKPEDFLVGTACFVRSWKGIKDLLAAARLLKDYKHLKWVVVGGGHVDQYRGFVQEMGLEETFTFTGHLESPNAAMGAMDIFLLLSTAHEGVSQASLQAAFLERPLITTTIGGLPEVCLEGETGYQVPPFSPEQVAAKVLELMQNRELRLQMGRRGRLLVEEKFTWASTLHQMEEVYAQLMHF